MKKIICLLSSIILISMMLIGCGKKSAEEETLTVSPIVSTVEKSKEAKDESGFLDIRTRMEMSLANEEFSTLNVRISYQLSEYINLMAPLETNIMGETTMDEVRKFLNEVQSSGGDFKISSKKYLDGKKIVFTVNDGRVNYTVE